MTGNQQRPDHGSPSHTSGAPRQGVPVARVDGAACTTADTNFTTPPVTSRIGARTLRAGALALGTCLALALTAGCGVPNLLADAISSEKLAREHAAPAPPVPTRTADQVIAGHKATFGDWEIVLHGTDLNAETKVLSENQFNKPPLPGHRFVMSDVTLTNSGTGEADILPLSFSIVGGSEKVYKSFEADNSCGVLPEDLNTFDDLDPGESRRGNICASIPAEEIDGAAWRVENMMDFSNNSTAVLPIRSSE